MEGRRNSAASPCLHGRAELLSVGIAQARLCTDRRDGTLDDCESPPGFAGIHEATPFDTPRGFALAGVLEKRKDITVSSRVAGMAT
jgi:hypothetical protein